MDHERTDPVVPVLHAIGGEAEIREHLLHHRVETRGLLGADPDTHRTGEILGGLRKGEIGVGEGELPARAVAQRERRPARFLVSGQRSRALLGRRAEEDEAVRQVGLPEIARRDLEMRIRDLGLGFARLREGLSAEREQGRRGNSRGSCRSPSDSHPVPLDTAEFMHSPSEPIAATEGPCCVTSQEKPPPCRHPDDHAPTGSELRRAHFVHGQIAGLAISRQSQAAILDPHR